MNDGDLQSFFWDGVGDSDCDLESVLLKELDRQNEHIELGASANIVSEAVLEAQGSVLTNTCADIGGRAGRHPGSGHAGTVESLAISRARLLFGCSCANVQPHSGSQANSAVQAALLEPGNTVLGPAQPARGQHAHETAPASAGNWFSTVSYGSRMPDCPLDYDEVEKIARDKRPKLIFAGGRVYSRPIDFGRFREIADGIGARLVADISPFAGLIATGLHPSPFPHAHVVTAATHGTLRGPRGGMILSDDPGLMARIDSAVRSDLRGGPFMHIVAAKAMAFGEALRPEFKRYMANVVRNAEALAAALAQGGLEIVPGKPHSHLVLMDLNPLGLQRTAAEQALARAHLTCDRRAFSLAPGEPAAHSAIRLGTAAGTTRGFGVGEFRQIGFWILEVLTGLAASTGQRSSAEETVREQVRNLCLTYPVYGR